MALRSTPTAWAGRAWAKEPIEASVSASTQEFAWAAYLREWVDRVERVGNLNYPDEARRRGLRGQVVISVAIRRDGSVVQFVPVERRAWHAGVSSWRGRSGCNDFSIGIELEGSEEEPFEPAQYPSLVGLIHDLRNTLPIRDLAAHSDVAPGRKTDPGAHFDWARLLAGLARR